MEFLLQMINRSYWTNWYRILFSWSILYSNSNTERQINLMHMKNWQALSVVFLACINFVYQAVIHCTVLSKRDSWDVFQLGEEFTECMKKTSFSKGNKVMEGVLGTTYFELYLALQEFCNYGQHLPERWALNRLL